VKQKNRREEESCDEQQYKALKNQEGPKKPIKGGTR